MAPFDMLTTLADLNSSEAELLDGSVVVTGTTGDLLDDLYQAFVFEN